jgi:hypothetical protein
MNSGRQTAMSTDRKTMSEKKMSETMSKNKKMRRHTLLLSSLILLCFWQQHTGAQVVNPIDPARRVDWTVSGISGGIPARSTQCGSTIAAYSGSAATINSALSACTAGQHVQLGAGTFTLSSGIVAQGISNVTLRGAGANQTLLVFSGGSNCWGQVSDICLRSTDDNWSGGPDNAATWAGSGPWPRGTTSITLSSVTNLAVGGTLILDQIDDLSDGGVIYNCEQSASMSPNQNPPCNDDSGATGGDSGAQRGGGSPSPYGQQQFVTVTGISGNTVTFTPGLYMPNWRVFSDSRGTQTPGAWWVSKPSSGMGVENLSADHTNSSAFLGIQLYNCEGCWVQGVRDVNSDRCHFCIYFSRGAVIRSNYEYGTKNSVSQSYGVEIFGSSNTLVENNIAQKVAAPYMVNSDCEGCVFDYNLSINDFYSASSNWMTQGVWAHSLTSNILIEGNVGAGMIADLFHGTHNFITEFRNRFDGNEPNNGTATSGNTNPLKIYPYSRFFNVIGNVLGTSGYHTVYQYTASPEQGAGDTAIMVLGTGPDTCCKSGDALVKSTMFLWGNYDTVNAAVRFVNSEVPSGSASYPNPIPASQALPASLYYGGRPGWWPAAKAWPPIGPDVTGGNIPNVGGHAYTIPAQDCYTTMGGAANGTGAFLTFNAATCYGSTVATPPSAPTNLKITGP